MGAAGSGALVDRKGEGALVDRICDGAFVDLIVGGVGVNCTGTAVGDTVETRGGDGIFPTGVPVGIVESVEDEPGNNYHKIIVRLSEDMTRSGFVYVVEDLRKAERDTLQQANERP